MKEITDPIQAHVSNDPEMSKVLDAYSNKFYFFSAGGWISEQMLFNKFYPNYSIKKTPKDKLTELYEHLRTILVLLLSTNKAISKVESDGVTRYKFTGDPKIHIEFLNKEKEFLNERLDWIEEKLKFFNDQNK